MWPELGFLRFGSLDCGGVLLVSRVLLGGVSNRMVLLESVLLELRGQNRRECVLGG